MEFKSELVEEYCTALVGFSKIQELKYKIRTAVRDGKIFLGYRAHLSPSTKNVTNSTIPFGRIKNIVDRGMLIWLGTQFGVTTEYQHKKIQCETVETVETVETGEDEKEDEDEDKKVERTEQERLILILGNDPEANMLYTFSLLPIFVFDDD